MRYLASLTLMLVGALVMSSGQIVLAQSGNLDGQVLRASNNGGFEIPLYKSGVIQLDQPAKRVSVGNPGIADILILRSRQLYVVGKALGTTNVALWDKDDAIFASFDIEVTHDLESLKAKLHKLVPDEDIKVHSAQERIILSGEVSNVVKMDAAHEVAFSYLPECIAPESNISISDTTGESQQPVVLQQGGQGRRSGSQECKEGSVVNLMQVGGAQQVMLEIKVAEIARTVLKRLDSDVNLLHFGGSTKTGAVSGGATFPNANIADLTGTGADVEVPIFDFDLNDSPIGPVIDRFEPSTPSITDTGFFLSALTGDFFFQAVLDISRQKGLAKILAEPTLTTLTGQQAEFLSGGEFPIPVPQGGASNTVTVEFKEFGVGVRFLPVVLDSGRINLKLNVSVSELSESNNIALSLPGTTSVFAVPSLTKRSAANTVELANGQTIGIAGLINDTTRQFVDKLPGLGDVPMLGALFRSQEFLSGQTELVIFVTPHLARPIAPELVRLPTDSFVPPDDLEFYLLGKMEAREAPARAHSASDPGKGGPEGARFGHQVY